jgi:hypothetical protein
VGAHVDGAVERAHADLAAEDRGVVGDVDAHVEVVAVEPVAGIGPVLDHQQQVASAWRLVAQAQPRAVAHARWHGDVERGVADAHGADAAVEGVGERQLERRLDAAWRPRRRGTTTVRREADGATAIAADAGEIGEAAAEEAAEEVAEALGVAGVEAARVRTGVPSRRTAAAPRRCRTGRRSGASRGREHRVGLVDLLEALLGAGSPGFRSGWCLAASFRKARRTSRSLASRATPRIW